MRVLSIALSCALFPIVSFAQSGAPPMATASKTATAAADPPVRDMAAVIVTGAQPGPGMWKVSNGDRVLWILGTVSPLPSGIEWKSDEVRGVLEQADQVLSPPSVVFDTDLGWFRGLLLAPAAMKAMKNPDGRTLREVLPAATYARWAALKQRYIGRDAGIEKKRPLLAAQELYAAAVKRSGLGGKVVSPVIATVLERRGMEYTSTSLKFTIKDPKAAIAEFREETTLGRETACMDETMDKIERDLPEMVARANAWATGDLETLRTLPWTEQKSCWSAWSDSAMLRKRGMDNAEARMRAKWLDVAETALRKNRTTIALLPLADLLKPDGYPAQLREKGYTVEEPL